MDLKEIASQINFKVISRQVRNLQKIIHTISYSVLASYDNTTNMWSYQKYKGPFFLIEDKLKQKKLVILNQYSAKDYIQPVHTNQYRYYLGKNGFMMNFAVQDSITGWTVRGIWTQDQNIKQVYKTLTEKFSN